MPKNLTPAMRAHLYSETTRLAAIWRITRKDGAQFFFTDHDRDIVFGGDTYRADAGFERTAIRSDAGFAVDNLDLVGVFAEGGIVEDEVRAGLFDDAEIRVSFVNWEDPMATARSGCAAARWARRASRRRATSTRSCGACRSRSPRARSRCSARIAAPTSAMSAASSRSSRRSSGETRR
jgi:uncharacterized phage protein (TIGR02218 family)